MKKIKKWICALVQNPIILFVLWFGVALNASFGGWFEGIYNNYIIFSQSIHHALAHVSLYAEYPKEYFDLFLYGIPFTFLIAPFSFLPPLAGLVLWCMANACLLYCAVKKIGLRRWQFAVVLWLSVNALSVALKMQQFNVAITAFIILSYVLIDKKKDFWAALFIVLGTLTKIYGIVGLAFFLFSKRRLHFVGGLLFWGLLIFVIPMLYTSPEYVIGSYREWMDTLLVKNGLNEMSVWQNMSFLGFIRKSTQCTGYSDLWIIIPAIILFILPYFRINQYENRNFRLSFLASVLLFIILFSTGSEESGYVAALIGVGIWFVSAPAHKNSRTINLCLLAFCVGLTVLSTSGIFYPKHIRVEYVVKYALRALPCFLIWLKIIWEQLTQDYRESLPVPLPEESKRKPIDIILPCYNPHEGWEQQMMDRHKELDALLENHHIRLIVVNDGSKRGLKEEAVQRLLAALPDTIFVDNKKNKGKGGAVRDGLAHSDSELTLYTDYDFPYETESIAQVVYWLEQGYDIVVANRNHTYYSRLSRRRKIASYASRILNFTLLGLTHTDTQGGLKGFNHKGKVCLASTRTKQFLFDTEFIYKASQDDCISIKDVSVDLRSNIMLPNMKKGIFMNELKNLFFIAWRR